jgi:predicted AAA+ superfamily ATPase
MFYKNRILETKLFEYIAYFGVVGLTGPRQSGKSTLLKHSLPNYTYVTFDDPQIVDLLKQDPQKFMRIYANKVIFDEVQKVPEFFNLIKIAIDNDRQNPGKFVLTGSSQFNFIKGVTESLAGRIGLLTQLPYQIAEMPGLSAALCHHVTTRSSQERLVTDSLMLVLAGSC